MLRNRTRSIIATWVIALMSGASVEATLVVVDNRAGTFEDISTTGSCISLGNDEEAVITATIGNSVCPPGQIVVADNGGIAFGSVGGQNDLSPTNQAIPSSNAFNGRQSLLPFWDDLGATGVPCGSFRGEGGDIFWKEIGNRLIIQYNGRPASSAFRVGDTVKFQIKIFGGVPNAPGHVYAQFVYSDIQQSTPNGGASATIGYQNGAAQFNDAPWSFDTAGAVHNGTVLSLVSTGVPVPAASPRGAALMAAGLAGLGGFMFRRGRRPATVLG